MKSNAGKNKRQIIIVAVTIVVLLIVGVGVYFGVKGKNATSTENEGDGNDVSATVESSEENAGDLGEMELVQVNPKRVLDYADMLPAQEEEKLEEYIAECESKYEMHFVLVIINQDVQGNGEWEESMKICAESHYDENGYGYGSEGDGVLLLDNWYKEQSGSYLLLVGNLSKQIGNYRINEVLGAVNEHIETDRYTAYKAYIDTVCKIKEETDSMFSR